VRFLVDESSGTAVVEHLRQAGHDVLAVAEIMPRAPDPDILAHAARESRILVTNDKDFGELAIRSGQAHSGIVLLRLNDERPSSRVRVLETALAQCADQLAGSFTVATESGIRVRPADASS
jgi:predicted nuclease of predicted toxin-antitoxin system